jgi:hypothetical protein
MNFDYSKYRSCDCRERYSWQEVRDAILGALAVAVIIWTLWMVVP